MSQADNSVNQYIEEDINLWDLLEQIKDGWKWWVAGGAFGLFGSMGTLMVVPEQYEATAVVQPAKITATATATTLEPPAQTLERLKLVTFYDGQIIKACQEKSAAELVKSTKVTLLKGNNLISLSYRAESPALANACVDQIFKKLAQSLSDIAAPLLKELENQTRVTQGQIDNAERLMASLTDQASKAAGFNDLKTLITLKRDELMQLQQLHRQQRIHLTEPLTQPTQLLEPIYVSEKPVSPKKLIVLLVSVLVGLFAGLMALFIRNSWRRHRLTTVSA